MLKTNSMVATNSELLAALRARTSDLHRALDARVSDRSLQSPEGYLRFLTMHARVLPSAEAWLQLRPEFRGMPDAPARLRSAALEHDFQSLGVPMPIVQNMSFLNETASVAGISYVLEGSRLGGAYLATLIARSGRGHPVNFLSHGREKPLWPTFLSWLSERELSPSSVDRAVRSAEAVFGAYLSALD